MLPIKCRSSKEHKRLFSRPSDASQTKITSEFLSYPAQESRGGMFMFVFDKRYSVLSV